MVWDLPDWKSLSEFMRSDITERYGISIATAVSLYLFNSGGEWCEHGI